MNADDRLHLRPYRSDDLPALLAVYGEAVRSQCQGVYSPEQVQAWARHALDSSSVAATIERGRTVVNPVGAADERIAAFAVIDPIDRLALLYCDGRWSRQGRAGALLHELEQHARSQRVKRLRTEASQLSRPLLHRCGWQVEAEETVLFAGVSFVRWRMIKPLHTADHG